MGDDSVLVCDTLKTEEMSKHQLLMDRRLRHQENLLTRRSSGNSPACLQRDSPAAGGGPFKTQLEQTTASQVSLMRPTPTTNTKTKHPINDEQQVIL